MKQENKKKTIGERIAECVKAGENYYAMREQEKHWNEYVKTEAFQEKQNELEKLIVDRNELLEKYEMARLLFAIRSLSKERQEEIKNELLKDEE